MIPCFLFTLLNTCQVNSEKSILYKEGRKTKDPVHSKTSFWEEREHWLWDRAVFHGARSRCREIYSTHDAPGAGFYLSRDQSGCQKITHSGQIVGQAEEEYVMVILVRLDNTQIDMSAIASPEVISDLQHHPLTTALLLQHHPSRTHWLKKVRLLPVAQYELRHEKNRYFLCTYYWTLLLLLLKTLNIINEKPAGILSVAGR